jgi:2-keto-4-pentenoate hydratase/2-oxohepta-3-ene-1,7-dioic acid hydratase in catechol pathway
MKLVSFAGPDGPRPGVWIHDGRTIVDLHAADAGPMFRSMQSLIEGGKAALERAAQIAAAPGNAAMKASDVRLLAPLPRPAQIRCFSVFEEHARRSSQAMMRIMAGNSPEPDKALAEFEASGRFEIPPIYYERPFYYKGNRFSVVGTNAEIRWPAYSHNVDFELELAAVIGREGKDLSADAAQDWIFGYSVFNDLTARDEQSREMVAPLGPAKGKDFDGGNVMGPCIVTADEIPNPYALRMRAWVDGELWTDTDSAGMVHSFEAMLAHVSRDETVYPGEVFLSGCAELGRYPRRGSRIELEIEGIGRLASRIV